MNLNQFITNLAEQGVRLWTENGHLQVRAPKGLLTPELRELLAKHKAELLILLERSNMLISNNELPLVPVSRNQSLPVSFAQEQLWFLNQLQPDNPAYNEVIALQLNGLLNTIKLKKSLNKIIEYHEVLRTNFSSINGQPVQVIAKNLTLTLPVIDLHILPDQEKEIAWQQFATEQAQKPFDLAGEPLIQAFLLKLTQTEHILLLKIHHIIWDALSEGLFVRQLLDFYSGFITDLPLELPPFPIQYVDFAVWQRQYFQGEVLQSHLAYWKQHLLGVPALLKLPTTRRRSVTQTFRGAHQRFALSKKLTESLMSLSQQKGVTLFVTLLAGFQTLLYRYTGQTDICIGTPSANRNSIEIEGLIGLFVNTLVLRTDISGNPSFENLLSRVRDVTLGAYAHQDLPFEKLVEELQPKRSLSYTPLCQVMFVLYAATPHLQMAGLTVSTVTVETYTSKFDLTLAFENTDSGLIGTWEYNTDLFDHGIVASMTKHFQTLLEGIVVNPKKQISEFLLLTETERNQLLMEWNNTTKEYPQDKCIHQLFEEQVERVPDKIAVMVEGEHLTYRELNSKANQLAHYLQSQGIGPDVLVSICLERSLLMIIGLLGILKAGGAYVPLDPMYPKERLAFMLENTSASVLLTQTHYLEKLPENQTHLICLDSDWKQIVQQSQENTTSLVRSDNLAYVMYTSGSTGKPKGVSILHRGVIRLVKETNYAKFSAEEVFLQLAPISFDASTFEIWGSLLNGGRLVIMPPHAPSLQELGHAVQRYQITTLWLTAGLFHLIVDDNIKGLKSVRQLLVGGDVLSVAHVQKALRELKGCQIINGYGPTENTTFTCCYAIKDLSQIENFVPIGRPITNTQVYILDNQMQPVPVAVAGELYIGGPGLARGYLNRPDLTAERFIPNPFSAHPGARLYKTGDLARYLPDGNIEFLGRFDNQVKISGFRIELGEIEAVLASHPQVQQTAVIIREDNPGDKRLVAYLVPQLGTPTASELRHFLKQKLPDYMVPGTFVILSSLPLSPNSKVDRLALPAPNTEPSDLTSFVPPRDTVEQQLKRIWSDVLQLPYVGVQDNFFELGGHSLLAVRLMVQIEQKFGINLPLATLFFSPTIAQLATFIRKQTDSLPWSPLVAIQSSGSNRPFFCVPGVGGNVICLYELAHHLGSEQPFYGLQAKGLDGKSHPFNKMEDIAAYYIEAIQTVQSQGPYLLGGHSFGGIVAFEITQQLQKQGHKVALLAVIDAVAPISNQNLISIDENDASWLADFTSYIEWMASKKLELSKETIASLTKEEQLEYLKKQLIQSNFLSKDASITSVQGLVQVYKANLQAYRSYLSPQMSPSNIALFRAQELNAFESTVEKLNEIVREPGLGWHKFSANIDIHVVPGNHMTMMTMPNVQVLAAQLQISLKQAQA